jgi:hypothetical protein
MGLPNTVTMTKMNKRHDMRELKHWKNPDVHHCLRGEAKLERMHMAGKQVGHLLLAGSLERESKKASNLRQRMV